MEYLLKRYRYYASWVADSEWKIILNRWSTQPIPKKKKGGSRDYNTVTSLKIIADHLLAMSDEDAKAFILEWRKLPYPF